MIQTLELKIVVFRMLGRAPWLGAPRAMADSAYG
jgi:hypothetical protein